MPLNDLINNLREALCLPPRHELAFLRAGRTLLINNSLLRPHHFIRVCCVSRLISRFSSSDGGKRTRITQTDSLHLTRFRLRDAFQNGLGKSESSVRAGEIWSEQAAGHEGETRSGSGTFPGLRSPEEPGCSLSTRGAG